jgi:hypothetical protein
VTSIKDQEQYWFDKRRPYRFVSVKQFSDLFKTFHVGQKMAHEIAVPYDKKKSHKAALVFEKYSTGRYELFKANFAKEWLLMKRNSVVYVSKTIQVSAAANMQVCKVEVYIINSSGSFQTEFECSRSHHQLVDRIIYLINSKLSGARQDVPFEELIRFRI